MATLRYLTARRAKTGTYYVSPASLDVEPRYVVSPAWREPKRGGGNHVRDGWHLGDTWTEVSRRFDTLEECERAIDREARDRDEVRAHKERWTGWAAATQTPNGLAELRVSEQGGNGSTMLGLVSTRNPEVRLLGVARLLSAAGLEGLPEVSRG